METVRFGYTPRVKLTSERNRRLRAWVVLAAATLAALAWIGVYGSAAAGQTAVICPELSGVLPCCGPPVAGPAAAQLCCPVPSTACCVTTGTSCCVAAGTSCCTAATCTQALTIAATPDPAPAGRSATITGALTGGTVAAQTVVLWQKLAGQATFTDVLRVQTDSSGGFRFTRVVQTNAEWFAKSGSIESPTFDESVRAAAALRASRVRRAAGTKLALAGSITPSHAGERVALEQLRGRRWMTIARPRLSAHSRFTVLERLADVVERFRVVLAADARNALTVSAVIVVRVS